MKLGLALVALFGAMCVVGCGEEEPPAKEPCAPYRESLEAIAKSADDFADVPKGDDAKTRTYFTQAAKLWKLTENAEVERRVIADLAALEEDPLTFGNNHVTPSEAKAEREWTEARRMETLDKIDALLAEADKNGLSLRDAGGGPVDAGRVLRATFWRDVAAQASDLLGTCNAEAIDAQAISKLIDGVHLIEVADAHELVETSRAAIYLEGQEEKEL